MSREQHLLNSVDRAIRIVEKRDQTLRFLRDEIWTDYENLGLLLSVKPSATYRTVAALQKDRLLRLERVPIVGGHITLIGITSHGQAFATLMGERPNEKVFAPNRVSTTYLRHTLDIQYLKIKAEKAGWTQWVNADRVEKWQTGKVRPDAFASDLLDRRVAIECERTIKSPKRYVQILGDWLQEIRQGHVDYVVWASPTPQIRERLKNTVTSISHVNLAGQEVLIPKDRFEKLQFLTYEEWPGHE